MEKSETTHLTRRQALKVLVASGGALAASAFLPARWTRPVVQAGVLLAHAQSTCPVVMRVLNSGTEATGYFVFFEYTPPDYFPTGVTVVWGGYQVVSSYDFDLPGYLNVAFLAPELAIQDCTVEITVQFNYAACVKTCTITPWCPDGN